MSMIWRSAMPLLTTLAALVIIVHCIEEDLDNEYQHHILTRLLDPEPRSTEESRRLLQETPIMPEPRDIATEYGNTSDEVPKRRRRKRKRRPQSGENYQIQDRFSYPGDPPRPFYDVDYVDNHKTTEVPKRRRKKQEDHPFRWVDDEVMDVERPIRQKGGTRRKRPSVETFPVLSEFGHIVINEPDDAPDKIVSDTKRYFREDIEEPYPHDQEYKLANRNLNMKALNVPDVKKGIVEDKSLSEFSLELGTNMRATKPNSQIEFKDSDIENINKPVNIKSSTENNKIQENNQVDPLTLKEILKKSNGTSLSEILQQHNISLSDLLNGNEQAVSILKSQDSKENKNQQNEQSNNLLQRENIHVSYRGKVEDEEQDIIEGNKFVTEVITEYTTERENLERHYVELVTTTTTKPTLQNLNKPKITTRRRYPISLRKKLRMRPVLNVTTTRKMQLSKDLIALNGRKYSMQRRNRTKSQEWKSVLDSFRRNNTHNESSTTELQQETTTETIFLDETTTIPIEIETNNPSYEIRHEIEDTKIEDVNESAAATDILTEIQNDTDIVASIPQVIRRPNVAAAGTRQQAFNNKLKRKRIKQKTTSAPETSDNFNLVGNSNLVTSKFATRAHTPRTLNDDDSKLNTLDDVTTTEMATNGEGPLQVKIKPTHHMTPKPLLNSTAKIEIEEILTDTRIRDKLAMILKERNMTLSELVDHRERGSSHVHLADIFHNASKEPNPPEPFLSKSLIEPISKETYPLRAILEANLHEANSKLPNDQNTLNIPVVVDYRNNVNENAENIGIMSLFNNFINSTRGEFRPEIEEKTEQIVSNKANNTFRESKKLNKEVYENWKELISLMKKGNNESEELHLAKKVVNEDADGDGLIFLEDLQNLYLEHNMALPPLDSTEIYTLDDDDPLKDKGILDKIPSQTRSVTIATASIAGLAMILFLLTYAAYKWKQSYMACKSRNFSDQRIPTPVFENRKGHKHNSSSRSISPMLQTPNVYTLDKLESQNGKDIPDYMWNTLRKPFQ